MAEFKEFKRRFKFKPRFKYGWFHLKLYQMFEVNLQTFDTIKPALNLNRVLADLNRGSNSLNSISGEEFRCIFILNTLIIFMTGTILSVMYKIKAFKL